MAYLQILNLDGDRIVRNPDGPPVLMDAGSDVEIIATEGDTFTRLDIIMHDDTPGPDCGFDSLSIDLTASISILNADNDDPGGVATGNRIHVDDDEGNPIQIGAILYADRVAIFVDFLPSATKHQVEQLIRAITYADMSGRSGSTSKPPIRIFLDSSNTDGTLDGTSAIVTIADGVEGADEDETFTARLGDPACGDRLNGRGG